MAIGKIGRVGAVNRDAPSPVESPAGRAAGKRDGGFSGELKGKPGDGPDPAPKDPRVLNAARMYEKQFLREMVRAMRGTVSFGELTKPNMAEEIYRGQLDEEYVEAWGDGGGLGLADLIHDEIMSKILSQSGRSRERGGPIPLSDRDVSRVLRGPVPGTAETALRKQSAFRVELKPDPAGGPAKVLAPFDAKVLATTKVDGKATVLLEHGAEGVRSALIFDGVAAGLPPGSRIAKGDAVGTLSPDAKSFFWNLSPAPGAPAAGSIVEPSIDPAKNSGPDFGR